MRIEINITYALKKLMDALNYTTSDLANILNVDSRSIYNYIHYHKDATQSIYSKIIDLIDNNNLDIYQLLDIANDESYLFHGSKTGGIIGKISVNNNINEANDFGNGFYLSKSFRNAVSYVVDRKKPIIYRFRESDVLKGRTYSFKKDKSGDEDWVIYIGLNRKKIDSDQDEMFFKEYYDNKFSKYSVLIGEIADSYNFEILNDFFNNTKDIEETKEALIKANIGPQYVIKDEEIANELMWVEEYVIEKKLKKYLTSLMRNKKKILKDTREKISEKHVFDPSKTFSEIRKRRKEEYEQR